MPRTESNMNGNVNGKSENVRRMRHEQSDEPIREQEEFIDAGDEEDDRARESSARNGPRRFLAQGDFQEEFGEQADFREHFDEDLYNDRAEAPVQGNTADVAMGEQRFGSDAEAYTEYAHRRPGEDSAVGQSRDPSDISNEDNEEKP